MSGSCDNETLTLDWSAAEGALIYTVIATGDLGYLTSFQTNKTTVELELPCGQLFTFTIRAQDSQCDSAVSLPKEFKTGPCIPEHLQSFTHCENNLGSVSWASSDGADSYVAFAAGKDGHVHMCTTSTTNCTWDDLHCGEVYTIHVIANDYLCSSMPSNSTSLRMGIVFKLHFKTLPNNLTMLTVSLFLSVLSTLHSSKPDIISELHDKGECFLITNHVCSNFHFSNSISTEVCGLIKGYH